MRRIPGRPIADHFREHGVRLRRSSPYKAAHCRDGRGYVGGQSLNLIGSKLGYTAHRVRSYLPGRGMTMRSATGR